jgi:uncharacterized metal-binding protein
MGMSSQHQKLPLVYSCSGASSAAQMANHIAVKLDRLKVAEMSCIAGVGGDVRPLVRTAKSGRPIIALDGCPLHCAAQILKRHGLQVDKHYDLSKMGVKKRPHEDFDPAEAARHLQAIVKDCAMAGHSPGANQSPAAGKTTPPAPGAATTASTAPAGQPTGSVAEAHEPASPVCYLAEFKDW